MAYHKVTAVARACAFCGTEFLAAHRRRIYCSNSCNTRACLARKGRPADSPPKAGLASTPTESAKVTLASNVQNWTMLALAPKLPGLVGGALQVLGDLFTPPNAGPSTWLPAALQQVKGPLAPLLHESWDEPRFFVKLSYAGHTLYYRKQHDLLIVREPDGGLRQVRTAAEFAALTPIALTGIAALEAQYEAKFSPPAHAPLLPRSFPLELGPEEQ